jgi:hypothetical protein
LKEILRNQEHFAWVILQIEAYLSVGDSGMKQLFSMHDMHEVSPLWYRELFSVDGCFPSFCSTCRETIAVPVC